MVVLADPVLIGVQNNFDDDDAGYARARPVYASYYPSHSNNGYFAIPVQVNEPQQPQPQIIEQDQQPRYHIAHFQPPANDGGYYTEGVMVPLQQQQQQPQQPPTYYAPQPVYYAQDPVLLTNTTTNCFI